MCKIYIMNNTQENNIKDLQCHFDILWNIFTNAFPLVKDVISRKDLSNFQKNFITKYEKLCDIDVEFITSNCLFERFVCSLNSDILGKQFANEINGICSAIIKALDFSKEKELIQKGIRDIVRNMILTIDVNPDNHNNDYRNRLNEILFFNWLSECENIEILSIEKQLGNGKSCDFECKHKDGTIILFEVLSINNIEINKQDNSQTFSDFVGKKVKEKFMDKTKNIPNIPNIQIIPILEYKEGLEDFKITLNYEFCTQPYTVIKNTKESMIEIFLGNLEEISECICSQKIHQ